MGLALIGIVKGAKGSVKGLRLLDVDAKQTKDIAIEQIQAAVMKGMKISGLGISNGKLAGSNGSLDRYPSVGANSKSKQPLIILKDLWGKGYRVSDVNGKILDISADDAVRYADSYGIANGKVVEKDGKKFISSISGNYERVEMPTQTAKPVEKKPEAVKAESVKKPVEAAGPAGGVKQAAPVSEAKPVNNIENRPVKVETPKSVEGSNKMVGDGKGLNDMEMSEEDKAKLAQARAALEAHGIKDVTDDDIKAIISESGAQMTHIISAVDGREGLKWLDKDCGMTVEQKMAKNVNIMRAIDPFAYAIYSGLEHVPVLDSRVVPTMGVTDGKMYFSCQFVLETPVPQLLFVMMHEVYHIAMMHIIRCGNRIAKMWNIVTDAYINKLLCEQFGITPDSGVSSYGTGNSRWDFGTQIDTRGLSQTAAVEFGQGGVYIEDIDTNTDTPEKLYEELMASRKPMGGSGKGGGNKGNNQQGQNGGGEQSESGDGQGSGGSGQSGDGNEEGQGNGGWVEEAEYELRGKKFPVQEIHDAESDLLEDEDSKGGSESEKKSQAEARIRRATVQAKQMGAGSSRLETMVTAQMAPKVDFRVLIRRQLLEISKLDRSFKRPDKRFLHANLTLPGPTPLDPDMLKGVKICIDTSGSIGMDELGQALGFILQLLKQFKASGDIVYWDTQVAGVFPFKDKESALKSRPVGGGGTDVNCVFEYFDSKDCKVKPSIVIIITDGYFGDVNKKYAKRYKDCIWIVNSDLYSSFQAPFGRKAPLGARK